MEYSKLLGEVLKDHRHLDRYVLTGVSTTGLVLGRGSYGSVVEVKYLGRHFAAKKTHDILTEYGNEGADKVIVKFLQECRLMANLHHGNITEFVGVWFPEDAVLPYLVMEKLEMSLDDLLVGVANVTMAIKLCLLSDVSRGLQYLHGRCPPIVHRDLTARNVLITSRMNAKITDLGNSRILLADAGSSSITVARATMTRAPGTLVYMAPEAVSESSHYGPPLDIFSFGHLALYTITQVFPSNLLSGTYTAPGNPHKILGRSEVERRQMYFDKADSIALTTSQHSLLDLVRQCLSNAPYIRPSASELLMKLKMIKEVELSENSLDSMKKLEIERVTLTKEVQDMKKRIIHLEKLLSELSNPIKKDEMRSKERDRELRGRIEEPRVEDREVSASLDEEKVCDGQPSMLEVKKQGSVSDSGRNKMANWSETVSHNDNARNTHFQTHVSMATSPDHPHVTSPLVASVKSNQCLTDLSPQISRNGALQIEWKHGTPLPIGMSGYIQSVAVGGVVYIGGGHANYVDYEFIVMSYDSSSGKWKKLPKYMARRFAMSTLEDRLVLVGGCNHSYEDINTVGVWDTIQKKWTNPFPVMPTQRSDSSAVAWNQWLLVAGGTCRGHSVDIVEVLNTTTDYGYWMSATPTPWPWSAMRSAVVGDMWYMLGGHTTRHSNSDRLCSVSIPALVARAKMVKEACASSGPELWTVSEGPGYEMATPVSMRGVLYAVGGVASQSLANSMDNALSPDKAHSPGIHCLHPVTGTWCKVGVLPTCLYNCTCTLTSSDILLVAGGYHSTVMKQFVSISKAVFLGNLLSLPTFSGLHNSTLNN